MMIPEEATDLFATQELQEIMQKWHEAIFEGDGVTAAHLRRDDFISVNPNGEISTKDEEIAVINSPDLEFESLKTEDVRVQSFGETAVVMGVTKMRAIYNGNLIDGRFRYTNIFAKQDGRWQAVVSQATECR